MPKLHVFAVDHVTYEPSDGALTRNVSALVRHLRRLKEESGVVKLGVEALVKQRKQSDPTDRYWRAVELHARRNRITLHSLESSSADEAILLVHTMLETAGVPTRAMWSSFQRKCSFGQMGLGGIPTSSQTSLRASKLFSELGRRFPEVDQHKLREICGALSVYRALRMHRNASRKGLKHVVVGAAHANELVALGLAHVHYLGGSEKFDSLQGAQDRVASYKQLKPLMQKLGTIAR